MLKMLPRGKSHFRGYLAFITIQPPLSELAVAIKYLNNCSAGLSNLIMLAYFSHVANKSGFMIVALGFLYFNDFCSGVAHVLSVLSFCSRMLSNTPEV